MFYFSVPSCTHHPFQGYYGVKRLMSPQGADESVKDESVKDVAFLVVELCLDIYLLPRYINTPYGVDRSMGGS